VNRKLTTMEEAMLGTFVRLIINDHGVANYSHEFFRADITHRLPQRLTIGQNNAGEPPAHLNAFIGIGQGVARLQRL
jgi:hypothetical protein